MPSGTKPTETSSPFSASEICAILESCHKNGVTSLKLGALQVEFYQVPQLRGNVPAGASQLADEETFVDTEGQFEVAESPQVIQKAELSDEDKALLEESRLAQLMTDDPAAYEQEMIDALQHN